MTRKINKKSLSLILSMMLIVAMACNMTGCNGDVVEDPVAGTEIEGTQNVDVGAQDEAEVQNNESMNATVCGEGETVFMFTVVDAEGNQKDYEIHTDKTIVGEALLELNLIEGDAGEFGLYVKTVDGITVDYDTDGKYWAFYINGEYAMTGVDATVITEGESYSFKVE